MSVVEFGRIKVEEIVNVMNVISVGSNEIVMVFKLLDKIFIKVDGIVNIINFIVE